MKKYLFICIFILLCAAPALFAETAEPLARHDLAHRTVNRYGMMVLGSWAVGNMALGGARYNATSGSDRYFHEMNIAWNSINLAIAGFGYYGALHAPETLSLASALQSQHSIEKILMLNIGLDTGYMMTGMYLREKSRSSDRYKDRLRGYGNSLVLQGGFLFVFDIALLMIHQQNMPILEPLLSAMTLTPSGPAMAMRF